jgi:hypothetical protein
MHLSFLAPFLIPDAMFSMLPSTEVVEMRHLEIAQSTAVHLVRKQ